MSDLVGNPEDQFSRVEAHICNVLFLACQALQNPADGSVVAPTSPVFQDEAVYSCNSGFTLSGQERRCCLSTGLWSGTAPTCVFAGR